MKLNIKEGMRNWLTEFLSKLEEELVPKWNRYGYIVDLSWKNTKENEFVQKIILNNKLKRKELLKDHPEIESLIDEVMKHVCSKNPLTFDRVKAIRRLFGLMHYSSNDGNYITASSDFMFIKGMPPVQTDKIRDNAIELEMLSMEQSPLRYGFRDNTFELIINDYLSDYVNETAKIMTRMDLDTIMSGFWTTNSGGETVQADLGNPILNRASGKRIVIAGAEADKWRDKDYLNQKMGHESLVNERTQIDRKPRDVTGVNNTKLAVGAPYHLILSSAIDSLGTSTSGKQTGTMFDQNIMLVATSNPGNLCVSNDMTSFDNTVSVNHQKISHAYALEVATKSVHHIYGPFTTSKTLVATKNREINELKEKEVNALQKVLSYGIRNLNPYSTIYMSNIFGLLSNKEGTFPSGILATGSNHTFNLTTWRLVSEKKKMEWIKLMDYQGYDISEFNQFRTSSLKYISGQGDDGLEIFSGRLDHIDNAAGFSQASIKPMGVIEKSDCSRNWAEYLKMPVVLGSSFPLPARLSITTVEAKTKNRSVIEKMREISGLLGQLSSRSENANGCLKLEYTLAMLMSRMTFTCDKKEYVEKLRKSSIAKKVRIEKKKHFIQIYLPFYFLFCAGGGELPMPMMERLNGTYTMLSSIFTPRGEYCLHYIYDICYDEKNLLEGIEKKQETRILCNPLVEYYNIDVAYYLVNMFGAITNEKLRLDEDTKEQLKHIATRHDMSKREAKMLAAQAATSTLKEKYNLRVPTSFQYHNQTFTRLLATYEQLARSKSEDIQYGRLVSEYLISFVPGKLSFVDNMKHYHYYISFENEKLGKDLRLEAILLARDISPCVNATSDYLNLISYFGLQRREDYIPSHKLALIRGKYWKMNTIENESINRFLLQAYKKGNKALEYAFKAMGVPNDEMEERKKLITSMSAMKDYRLRYTQNPALMSMITTNPISYELALGHSSARSVEDKLLALTIVYCEIQRMGRNYEGERINVHSFASSYGK
jgi:hypothetical protein